MLHRVASGASAFELELWQTAPCLVAPRAMARLAGFRRACAESASAGWPVHLRDTGGGLVPQGAGIANISFAYASRPRDKPSIKAAYQRLCAPILRELRRLDLACGLGAVDGALCDGLYNVNVAGRKFAGTAQRWRRMSGGTGQIAVFAHAVLLIRPDTPAAVEAANRLYEGCGVGKRVRPEAHTALSEYAEPPGFADVFLGNLKSRFAAELDALCWTNSAHGARHAVG